MQRIAPAGALFAGRGARRNFAAAAAEMVRSGFASSGCGGGASPALLAGDGSSAAKEQVFWMRDPKTGNWIPENRFGEVHEAELREILLSKK